jgi:hypothetical protein
MGSRLHTIAQTDTKKPQSDWVSTQRQAGISEVRENTGSPMASDIDSPHDSPASSQRYSESLGFGDSNVDFI